MKGMIKAVQRTPHHLTSRVGMAKKSSDLEFDDMERKFKSIEQATEKLFKDSKVFRDAVLSLLMSGESFGNSFSSLFSPLGAEYDLIGKNPQAEATIKNCGQYAQLMNELRTSLSPELELIDSRVIGPCKDLQDVLKKIRKTITKRDHKLVDYDRHNNSLNKLRDKKEKSLSDEKNLFKVEQDHEAATAEYEHYNGMLKEELPAFLVMGTKFIDPLFHSFYFMQLNIFYMMLEKLQTFTEGRYDLSRTDLDNIYDEQLGDVGSTLEALPVVQRQVSTAKLMAQAGGPGGLGRAGLTAGSSIGRTASTSSYGAGAKAPLGRQTSTSSVGKTMPPPMRGTGGAAVAPPAYTPPPAGSDVGANPAGAKRAPPPPPPLKPKPSYGAAPAVKYVVALFDFEAQAAGDLSFSVGDRIELVERTGSAEDWWTGRVDGRQGVFPGNYVQEE